MQEGSKQNKTKQNKTKQNKTKQKKYTEMEKEASMATFLILLFMLAFAFVQVRLLPLHGALYLLE